MIVRCYTNHSSIGSWDQGRASVAYRSARIACSHVPKVATYSKTVSTQRPSILALQNIMPVYARALRPLTLYFPTTSIQSRLASLEISVVWRALVALAYRTPSHLTPPSSPNHTLTGVNGKRGRAVGTTPPTTPPSTQFHLEIPPSCPCSPPLLQTIVSVTTELYAIWFPHYPDLMPIKSPRA